MVITFPSPKQEFNTHKHQKRTRKKEGTKKEKIKEEKAKEKRGQYRFKQGNI